MFALHMRRDEMKQILGDTALLWLLLGVIALIHGAEAVGLEVSFIERTILWRIQQYPGFIPPDPEKRFFRARDYSSATPVVSVPEGQAPRSLIIHPRLTREQVRENAWREGGGWSIGEVLRSGKLEGLPVTDERRVQALLEPALASGILVTAEGRSVVQRGLWGVVVEAEGQKGTRRLFLSLGAGEPTRAFSPYYQFLFEEPAGGGPLRLLEARNVFPSSSSGFEGIEPPGLFIIYLLVFLVLALFVSVLLPARSPSATEARAGSGQPRS
jgi:hypothetical protein